MTKTKVEKAEKVKKFKPPKTVYGWDDGGEAFFSPDKFEAECGDDGDITYVYTLTGKAVAKNGKLKVLGGK